MSEYICVFDCETIPDSHSLRKVFGYDGQDYEVAIKAQEEQEKLTGSSFLPVNFHKVVCISAVMADGFGKFLRVNTMKMDSEKDAISQFLNFIDKFNPRLVSFNGRGFDLPMLMIRAMRYNLSCYSYFDIDNKELGKNKWENYKSRYDGRFHLDLLDHISDFKAVSGLKLDNLCVSLNLPGKFDTHGDEVLELYYNKELDKISKYCESDVLNTYMLFLKYELLKGNLNLSDYANYLDIMKNYLNNEKSESNYTPVFVKCIDEELERLKIEIS